MYESEQLKEVTQETIKTIIDCDGKLKTMTPIVKLAIENLINLAKSVGRMEAINEIKKEL